MARSLGINLSNSNGNVVQETFDIQGGGFIGAFLMSNVSDPAGEDVFFSYSGANGGNDHVKLLGSNTFGFEDQGGLGDADFDDVIANISFA